MVFNSVSFLIVLALAIAVQLSGSRWWVRKSILLVISYGVYAAWNPPFVLLLWLSTAVDWNVGKHLATAQGSKRKTLLFISLFSNLGLLIVFKYGEFLLKSFSAVLALFGVEFQSVDLGIILPVGISFYTFQTLSYTIDIYRGQERPWKSLLDFSLFVSFFPQLVAGPIVRSKEFRDQCTSPRQGDIKQMSWGFALLIVGLFQKLVLADGYCSAVADQVFATSNPSTLDAWIGVVAFHSQIFFDFNGYTTSAIGVALALGFVLPDNFRSPYASIGFAEFWRRWHISFSTWLRDYLYIPLGGNRRGSKRTSINLGLTMLLGGLWHGAAWTYVVWGALHGFYLMVERAFRKNLSEPNTLIARIIGIALTFFFLQISWVIFRATSFTSAIQIFKSMFSFVPGSGLDPHAIVEVFAITFGLSAYHYHMRHKTFEDLANQMRPLLFATLLAFMMIMILLAPGSNRAFIYFQF